MGHRDFVHIIDADESRRARIAHQLYKLSVHAEIYEDVKELISRPPSRGAVLLSEDLAQPASDVLWTIQSKAGHLPIGMFSSQPSPKKIVHAMASGAVDYLEWPCPLNELREAVQRLSTLAERQSAEHFRKSNARERIDRLTRRETDVLKMLLAGASNKHMADDLGISPRTVEIHRANMMSKLDAVSMADAIRIGIYGGLDSS